MRKADQINYLRDTVHESGKITLILTKEGQHVMLHMQKLEQFWRISHPTKPNRTRSVTIGYE